MDILTFVKKEVNALSYKDLEAVALETGIPYGTLMKIKGGETENPRINTIQPLLNYFKQKNQGAT